MSPLLTEANRERFLTVRWNNSLAAGIGLPALAYAASALLTSSMSDRAAFFGLAAMPVEVADRFPLRSP